MPNKNGNAYALTTLIPIRHGVPQHCPEGMEGQTHTACVRYFLQDVLRVSEDSPMARVPDTYLSRFCILNDVGYQGKPAILEHLKGTYLVFTVNFHGELEPYLAGMWKAIEPDVRTVLEHCFGFEAVHDSVGFIAYIKKCQIETMFFFDGSTDEPLAVQLKSLYLKQEFSKFAFGNQGRSAQEIQAAFQEFVARTQPDNLEGPTWKPGAYQLETVVTGQKAMGAGAK